MQSWQSGQDLTAAELSYYVTVAYKLLIGIYNYTSYLLSRFTSMKSSAHPPLVFYLQKKSFISCQYQDSLVAVVELFLQIDFYKIVPCLPETSIYDSIDQTRRTNLRLLKLELEMENDFRKFCSRFSTQFTFGSD